MLYFHSRSKKNEQLMKDYFAHETAVIDEGCEIGAGTKIWHFSHIMPNCTIGEKCNIGQNVVILADNNLSKTYKAALEGQGIFAQEVDATKCTLDGLSQAFSLIHGRH